MLEESRAGKSVALEGRRTVVAAINHIETSPKAVLKYIEYQLEVVQICRRGRLSSHA